MDTNRYVQLTDAGLNRLNTVRRKYGATVEDIVGDPDTPSSNTIKRTLRQGPVFVSTLERIWDYFQRRAAGKREVLSHLVEGEDYIFVESTTREEKRPGGHDASPARGESRQGWISRQVPRPNRLFTGRGDVLERLHRALQAAGPATTVTDPQALTGLGGMGKTQTALAYLYKYRNEYSCVFWVNAETVQDLNDGLASIAEELNLLEGGPATKHQALARVHEWFRNATDWLLVLDNADDIEKLAPHFPRYHSGRLLLTTRARNTVKWAAPIPLVKFDLEDGALLLLRRAGILGVQQSLANASPDTADAARQLCDALGGLPLAINQAGAHLAETNGKIADYLMKYRRYGLELLDSVHDPEHVPVTITFNLALEQMSEWSIYGPAAVEVVRLCAFLAPDAIPEAIFTSYRFARPGQEAPIDGAEHFDAICAAVCSYSLATRNSENGTLSVHRLVQEATRETITREERHGWMERVIRAVADATPDFEFKDWPLCDLLLPHWRLCANHIGDAEIETSEAAYMLYQAGRYLRVRALYDEADTFLKRALALAERVHGPIHDSTASCLDELACLYREIDRAANAEPLHERALAITEQIEGPDHPETASRLHNMALFYSEQKEFAKAEKLFLRSLEIREKYPECDTLLVAATLTQLAGVYRYQGDFNKAEPYYRRALEMYESVLDAQHVDIATACNNLGLLCINIGHYEEAEELLLRSVRINERARGKEHPETATAVWSLAFVRWKQNRVEEADELYRRAIRVYTKHFGPEHTRVARLLNHYADFQKDTGRTVEIGTF
jgi:tetratricopeptide (TPR) repeat protein